MNLSNLKPAKGAVKKRKRIGRGEGSGHGGTSTKGHKGQKAISGYNYVRGFEGGQMPIQRRMPKVGFKNINRKEFTALNLDKVQELIDKYGLKEISPESLYKIKAISKTEKYKILGRGELKSKVEITAHAFSETAKKAIETVGASIKQVK